MRTPALLLTLVSAATVCSQSCLDFVVDSCGLENHGLIETINSVPANVCQLYCSDVFAGRCSFFVLRTEEDPGNQLGR